MVGQMPFLEDLARSSARARSLVCVGLDPEPDLIPGHLGSGPQAAAGFLRRIIQATAEHAAAYKPNLAFFEQYGPSALDILALAVQSVPAGIPVILDGKRGDVPNTAAAYARALFDQFGAHAVTVSPYLGLDAIAPFCSEGRYAFVLARTSNPGAKDLQDLVVEGRPLYEHVVERCTAAFPREQVGFVVGATYPEEARRLRVLAPDSLFLMPGVGAQGADPAVALRAAADRDGGGLLIASSRSILFASRGPDFDMAAGHAARDLKDLLNRARDAVAT